MATAAGKRDQRLDFCRGLALFMIFVDHIPDNVLGHFTIHAVAFSDAAEVFIFISGYVAALVFGRIMQRQGFVMASAHVLRRVWQLYVAHLTLFMIFMAEVSYTLMHFSSPLFRDELRVGDFLTEPHIAIAKALTLQFQPTFLDILPLYISLLLFFPLVLLAMRRHILLALLPSLGLYLLTRFVKIEVPAYPDGHSWFFDPLSWQFLFVVGNACGYATVEKRRFLPQGRWVVWLAGAVALLCGLIRLDWEIHSVWQPFPWLLGRQLWPFVDKTSLASLRLINFFALAILTARLISADAGFLSSRWAGLVIGCGRKSLYIFCFGILLSVFCRFLQVEFNPAATIQLLYSAAGLALMMGLASVMLWFDEANRRARNGERRA